MDRFGVNNVKIPKNRAFFDMFFGDFKREDKNMEVKDLNSLF